MARSDAEGNRKAYDRLQDGAYRESAPHLRHRSIRDLYEHCVSSAYRFARDGTGEHPLVLDIGAGDGTVTRPFLMFGAHVLAVDISDRQLEQLVANCQGETGRLEIRLADIEEVLKENRRFDIVVANSVLHHFRDYLGLIERALDRLSDRGVFLCFQDPMWAASISTRDALFSWVAYATWRLRQQDVILGVGRRMRRSMGIYLENSLHDNTEYHAVRYGVSQSDVLAVLKRRGFDTELTTYCSMHSDFWQPVGERLGVKNTFAILATRNADPCGHEGALTEAK